MTPPEFQLEFTPYAEQAANGTGLQPGLFLAQWAVETAYASVFAGTYNLGNITRGGASQGFVNYGSYAQFVDAEILLLHDAVYAPVLASVGSTLGNQCIALGASPWDAGHYDDGGGPGSSLIATLPLFGMSSEQLGGDSEMLFLVQPQGSQAIYLVDPLSGAKRLISAAEWAIYGARGQTFVTLPQAEVDSIPDIKLGAPSAFPKGFTGTFS